MPEAVGAGAKTEDLGYGINDFDHLKYDGPCPPEGDRSHRYFFRLAALRRDVIAQAPKMSVAEIWNAAKEHVIATAELTGTYAR